MFYWISYKFLTRKQKGYEKKFWIFVYGTGIYTLFYILGKTDNLKNSQINLFNDNFFWIVSIDIILIAYLFGTFNKDEFKNHIKNIEDMEGKYEQMKNLYGNSADFNKSKRVLEKFLDDTPSEISSDSYKKSTHSSKPKEKKKSSNSHSKKYEDKMVKILDSSEKSKKSESASETLTEDTNSRQEVRVPN